MTFPPCPILKELLETKQTTLPDGRTKRLVANINIEAVKALYDTVRREEPKVVVEIGMAQGVSTLSILSAVAGCGGTLVSIDPYNGWKSARDAALFAVERAGYAELHQHIEAPSYEALPKLLCDGVTVNFAYIDGAHDFANVFIDMFYIDRLLSVGGVVGFNDAGWTDVDKVIGFLRRQRRYEEIDVGLNKNFRGRNTLYTFARVLLNRSREDRYFRKRTGLAKR